MNKNRVFPKRIWIVSAILALAFMLSSCSAATVSSQLMNGIRKRGLIRVGFKTDVQKFSHLDGGGNIAGFERDLAERLAAGISEAQLQVKAVHINSCTAYPRLEKGELDCLVATMGYEKARSKNISYTKPYYTDATALLCQKGAFTSADQIVEGGKRIGYTDPDVIGGILNGLKEDAQLDFEMVSIASYPEAVDALKNGRIDAFCSSYAALSGLVDASTTILPESLGDIDYCVVLGKGEEKLAERISHLIGDMRRSGELQDMLDKWGIE